MEQKVLVVAPPFSQLNTPYPAINYLQGFFEYKKIPSNQIDLSIDTILQIFCKKGLNKLFDQITIDPNLISENSQRIIALKTQYLNTVDIVISFLQGQDDMLSQIICNHSFLPQAGRFNNTDDLDWTFGNMGIRDKARHLCTLYLEDLSDLIIECIDPYFGFSRYAERLSSSAFSFDPIYNELNSENSIIIELQNNLLNQHIINEKPTLIAISVPFPGNLFSALKCGQFIKANYPNITITIGGGYPNTELRSITDERIFDFTDFITLDDGETPLINLIEYLDGSRKIENLKRTFICQNNTVKYINNSTDSDFSLKEDIAPSYSNINPNKYLSVIEISNPMHRLWSDGFWLKLTMAHGCYWGKCSFCDVSLDYIKRYDPVSANVLCNKVESLIQQTGKRGFHFVDEAAPPALMVQFAKEVIKRKLKIVWWTNIRFEQQFTLDVCLLLKESGCIAVAGGLEVASERILKLINKGVNITKVAQVCYNFTSAGIMTHAYLMYGFPTQTTQETIDSLEVVRQLFENNVLKSGFWHQFAMTAHSPVGLNPTHFNVEIKNTETNTFANNDLEHIDKQGTAHHQYSDGLKKSLFNFMHDIGFDFRLQEWFEFKVPPTSVAPDYIYDAIEQNFNSNILPNKSAFWLNELPYIRFYKKNKKGKSNAMAELSIHSKENFIQLNMKEKIGVWLMHTLNEIHSNNNHEISFTQMQQDFESKELGVFLVFINGHTFKQLRENGLLFV